MKEQKFYVDKLALVVQNPDKSTSLVWNFGGRIADVSELPTKRPKWRGVSRDGCIRRLRLFY